LELQQAPVHAEISDNINHDFGMTRFMELSGAPSEMRNAKTLVKQIREERKAALAAQQEREEVMETAEVARNLGQAAASQAQAA